MTLTPLLRSMVVAAVVALGTAVSGAGVAPASPAPGSTTGASTTASSSTAGGYLSLGDSLAAGYQPARGGQVAGDDPTGGYTGVVADGLARRGERLRVTNLACTGETSTTMLTGGRCAYREGSQLAAARAHLRAHRDTRLVTVTVGANDVRTCLAGGGVDYRCAWRELGNVGRNLEAILGAVRREAPQARIVVLDYYNPYLAARLTGRDGQRLATAATLVQSRLNSVIRREAADHGARTARIAAAFESTDLRRIDAPIGRVPRNVARICAWTWMCTAQDIHANDAGYDIMGKAVLTRLADTR